MAADSLIGKRVLVIDDDTIFFEIVNYFFSNQMVIGESATSIKQGLEKLKQERYDFILIDSFLPDGMGIEVIPVVKALKYRVPMMMVTANDDQEYMQACFEAGVSDYILKPANIELVWLKIQRCYNSFVMARQLQQQNKQLESLLNEKQQEENLARHVYRHLSESSTEVDKAVECNMQSSSLFNGDFFVSGHTPSGNKVFALVDATGHGLAAAISVLPLVSAIKSMVEKGLSLHHLAYEINAKLYNELPDDRFVAGIGVEYDVHLNKLFIFNAGMPEALLLDAECRPVQTIKSESLPLGILDQQSFNPVISKVSPQPGQFLLLYSDGLIEQMSAESEYFGKQKFQNVLNQCEDPSKLVGRLIDAFNLHRGDEPVTDDVSVCCINLDVLQESEQSIQENGKVGDIDLSMKVNGHLLGKTDLLSTLDDTLKNSQIDISLRKKAYTVFAELFNNALDHGVLDLESSLKSDYSGFTDYLQQREDRLNALAHEDQINVALRYSGEKSQIEFEITDSGSGFEKSAVVKMDDSSLSGRGIKLVQELSEEYRVTPPGNASSVVIK